VACCFHAVVYQLAFGRAMTGYNFGTGFATEPPIPHDFLIDRLREGQVLLDAAEFGGPMDRRYYISLERLARRYGQLPATEPRLHYSDEPGLSPAEGWIVLTRTVERLPALGRRTGLCISLSQMRSPFGHEALAVRMTSAVPGEQTACVGSPSSLASIGGRLSFGSDHLEEGLRHGLTCAGPYCDSSRRDFVYVAGGDVSFLLRTPSPVATLCIGVIPTSVTERQNPVLVNGHPVGTLSAETVGASGEARFLVRAEAATNDPLWRITIQAPREAGTPGWDLRWAELRAP
jgi:hypothetical protein